MNKISKLLLSFLVSIILCSPGLVAAAGDYGLGDAQAQAQLPTAIGSSSARTVTALIGELVGIGLTMLGVIFFLLMLYGGFYWMIAKGDSAKVDKAKEIMEAAIIGLIIITGSYAIANFIFSSLKPGA
ncbi:MAG: hypothetical protein WCX97_04560 [Candidatus Magasanikbacteria bacterium]